MSSGTSGLRDLAPLLAPLRLPLAAEHDLARRMAAPGRCYHGPEHLGLLWQRHCRFGRGSAMAAPAAQRLIAAAIAFHDAVLVPGRRDNECRSARLWRQVARRSGGFTPADIDWVAGTILATANHLALPPCRTPRDRLRAWMVDLDLSPLGEQPPGFRRNTDRLRQEAARRAEAPDAARDEAGRRGFLQRLHQAPRLFRTPCLHRRYEAAARANIAAALAGGGPF